MHLFFLRKSNFDWKQYICIINLVKFSTFWQELKKTNSLCFSRSLIRYTHIQLTVYSEVEGGGGCNLDKNQLWEMAKICNVYNSLNIAAAGRYTSKQPQSKKIFTESMATVVVILRCCNVYNSLNIAAAGRYTSKQPQSKKIFIEDMTTCGCYILRFMFFKSVKVKKFI